MSEYKLPDALIGLEAEAGEVINLTEKELAHVAQRHLVDGAKTAGKNLFHAGTDVKL